MTTLVHKKDQNDLGKRKGQHRLIGYVLLSCLSTNGKKRGQNKFYEVLES
jgi:hypothetical protein